MAAGSPPTTSEPAPTRARAAIAAPHVPPPILIRQPAPTPAWIGQAWLWGPWPLFVAAFLLRLLFLETIPNTVTADELDFASNALQVLVGQGPGPFGLDWTPEPALTLYLIVGSWLTFGQSVFAERLPEAVLTSLAVFPFYALVRRLVAARSAWLATALFAAARWLLLFGRSGWNNGATVFFLLFSAWLLTRALETGRRRYWLGFGAGLALLLYGYFAGRAVVLAFAAYLALRVGGAIRSGDDANLRRLLAGAALAGLTCIALVLPEMPTIAQNWSLFNRRTSAVFVFAQPLPPDETPIAYLADATWTVLRSFLLMDPTVNSPPAPGLAPQDARYIAPGWSWLDPVSAGLYVIGLVVALRRPTGLVLWWCLLLIPLALTQVLSLGTPDGARALPAVAPMFVFVALTIDQLRLLTLPTRMLERAVVAAAIVIGAWNVYAYMSWINSPAATQARQPAVPVSGFATWRDFQLARLRQRLGVLPAGEYDQLSPAAIAAQIAGVPLPANAAPTAPGLPTTPPVNGPPQTFAAPQVGAIGAPGRNAGQLQQPRDVAVTSDGSFAVADSGRNLVVVYAADGQFSAEWAPSGTGPSFQPWAIAAGPDGSLFVLDARTGNVGHYNVEGALLGLASIASPTASTRGLTRGLDGVYYVAQTPANRVERFDANGGALPDLGAGIPGKLFDQPTSAVGAGKGAVFVYEPDSGRLQLHNPDGRLLFTLTTPRVSTLDAGRLLALPDGRILLADVPNHRVDVYRADGGLAGSFPVAGTPQGMAVTSQGNIAVADEQSGMVRLYALGH